MQAVHPSAVSRREAAEGAPAVQRVGGAVGILGGLAILIPAAVLIPLSAAHGLTPPLEGKEAQFFDLRQATLPIVLPLSILQEVGITVTLIFVRALDQRLRPVSPAASPIAALYGYIAVAILALATFTALDQTIAAGAAKAVVLPMITAFFVLNGTAAFAGSLFHVAWLVAVNWIALRRSGLPRVVTYYGFLAAAISLVAVFLAIKGIGPLTIGIWYIGAGAVMWLRPMPMRASTVADLP